MHADGSLPSIRPSLVNVALARHGRCHCGPALPQMRDAFRAVVSRTIPGIARQRRSGVPGRVAGTGGLQMSRITAIIPCRNSGWILGFSARALLMWCDEIIIGLHACTDSTADIVSDLTREYPGRIDSVVHGDDTWREMEHRQHLLFVARERGATHIVILDDDEVVSSNLLPSIRRMVESTPRGSVLQLPWVQLKGSVHTYIASGMWSQQCASTAFPDDPAYCWKPQAGDYQHHHRHPMGKPLSFHMPLGRDVRNGGLLHLQMVSDKRLRYKQLAYTMQELVRWPGRKTPAELNAMYGPTVYAPGATLAPVPAEWWAPYGPLMKYLDVDAEPWQAEEVRRLWREHGPEKFAGLDLFGVEL